MAILGAIGAIILGFCAIIMVVAATIAVVAAVAHCVGTTIKYGDK